jgi:S1-C subfamily serine protease
MPMASRIKMFGILVLGLLLSVQFAFVQSSWSKDLKDIYTHSTDSVLLVVSSLKGDKFATGTAFAIDDKGTFLTAYHVIEDANDLLLVDKKHKIYNVEKVLWQDKDTDLAVIQTNAYDFQPLELASYKTMSVGERISVISYPKGLEVGGLENTLSAGLLSSIRERFLTEREDSYNPKYDKGTPEVFDSKKYLEDFYNKCKLLVQNEEDKLHLYSCSDKRVAIVDQSNNGSIVYDNFDLAVNVDQKIYYFKNKSPEVAKIYKFVGSMIQYTTPISSGSSGGPIFNEKGQVVAVVNSYLENAQNVNYGRPIDYIPAVYQQQNASSVKVFAMTNAKTDDDKTAKTSLLAAQDSNKKCNQGNIQLNEELSILKCGPKEFMLVQAEMQSTQVKDKDFILKNFLKSKTKAE